jgi:hypothetical protein
LNIGKGTLRGTTGTPPRQTTSHTLPPFAIVFVLGVGRQGFYHRTQLRIGLPSSAANIWGVVDFCLDPERWAGGLFVSDLTVGREG